MRGKQKCLAKSVYHARITPAHAGKTPATCQHRRITPDHPRACGENSPEPLPTESEFGSPPRMRGKQEFVNIALGENRITPAHAGKTCVFAWMLSEQADHPRACGENPMSKQSRFANSGSPPRMRGKPSHNLRIARVRRITPAHAGKTLETALLTFCATDHPRACGENCTVQDIVTTAGGSPPRMRGKLAAAWSAYLTARITPACAGKTAPPPAQARRERDHPRVCGENWGGRA